MCHAPAAINKTTVIIFNRTLRHSATAKESPRSCLTERDPAGDYSRERLCDAVSHFSFEYDFGAVSSFHARGCVRVPSHSAPVGSIPHRDTSALSRSLVGSLYRGNMPGACLSSLLPLLLLISKSINSKRDQFRYSHT